MRLEVADAYLSDNNDRKAQEMIQKFLIQARGTLADARRAIDDLREKSAAVVDYKEAVIDEVRHFTDATGIPVETQLHLTKGKW